MMPPINWTSLKWSKEIEKESHNDHPPSWHLDVGIMKKKKKLKCTGSLPSPVDISLDREEG